MQNKQKMQSSVFGVLKFTKPQKHMFFGGWGVKAVVSYKLIQLALVSEVGKAYLCIICLLMHLVMAIVRQVCHSQLSIFNMQPGCIFLKREVSPEAS